LQALIIFNGTLIQTNNPFDSNLYRSAPRSLNEDLQQDLSTEEKQEAQNKIRESQAPQCEPSAMATEFEMFAIVFALFQIFRFVPAEPAT
jgi:hypothetical protein